MIADPIDSPPSDNQEPEWNGTNGLQRESRISGTKQPARTRIERIGAHTILALVHVRQAMAYDSSPGSGFLLAGRNRQQLCLLHVRVRELRRQQSVLSGILIRTVRHALVYELIPLCAPLARGWQGARQLEHP